MTTFQFLDISANPNDAVYIGCSERRTLQEIEAELPTFDAKARISVGKFTMKIEPKSYDQLTVKWWVVQQLCKKGWEPRGNGANIGYSHCFRLKQSP